MDENSKPETQALLKWWEDAGSQIVFESVPGGGEGPRAGGLMNVQLNSLANANANLGTGGK